MRYFVKLEIHRGVSKFSRSLGEILDQYVATFSNGVVLQSIYPSPRSENWQIYSQQYSLIVPSATHPCPILSNRYDP